MAGIKFARNTRASLKRLFVKVKAAANDETGDDPRVGEAGPSNEASETDEEDHKEESISPKATPARKQKKGIAVKKVTPRKRSGIAKKAPTSRGKAVVHKAKKPVNEVSDDDEDEEEYNDGKFIILTFHPRTPQENPCNGSANGSESEHRVHTTGNGTDTVQTSEEDDAKLRGMTVEEWRAWKIEHDYDAYHSHCPTPVWYSSEEVA
jgi:hypothetical protein